MPSPDRLDDARPLTAAAATQEAGDIADETDGMGEARRPFLGRWGLVISASLMAVALLSLAAAVIPSSSSRDDTIGERQELQVVARMLPQTVLNSSGTAPTVPPFATNLLGQVARRVEAAARQGDAAKVTNKPAGPEDPVAEMLAQGPMFTTCCKVVKRFGGKIPDHMQHWWQTSSCHGQKWDGKICDQALTVTDCCGAQKEYGIVPGKTFGSMPAGGSQQWWSNTGCDALVGRNLSERFRHLLPAANSSGDGEDTNSSENSTADVPKLKLCELALATAEASKTKHNDNITKSHTHGTCSPFFTAPEKPSVPDGHNGVALQDVCFSGEGPFHAFIIGDWGSLWGFKAAPHLGHRKERGQGYVWPIDEHPQILVRDQMRKLAPTSKPDYVLNVGDDFYWQGIDSWCGKEDFENPATSQFQVFFEEFYTGEGLDGKQWLGILGNHDYGGYLYHTGWDQIIGYTWNKGSTSTGRWMNPAQYWRSTVRYPDFSVDYYFLDTNTWDANPSWDHSPRNICGYHNGGGAHCPAGLNSTWICPTYFRNLWEKQKAWLGEVVPLSTADWRVVVTHFPPYFGKEDWQVLAPKHGIDLVITGHRHSQFVRQVGDDPVLIWPDWGNSAYGVGYTDFLDPTAWVVSGGGGGITSEHAPSHDGNDDQYGFMDMTLSKENLKIDAYSHSGVKRHTIYVNHEYRTTSTTTTSSSNSTDTDNTTTTSPEEIEVSEEGSFLRRAESFLHVW
jgi:hypothetical protein